MKLRYYLRGIGLGIIVAAAICICASVRNGKMSDEQVKIRAAELGMTEGGTVLSEISAAEESAVVPEVEQIAKHEEESKEAQVTPVIEEIQSEESTASVVVITSTEEDTKEEVKAEEPKKEEPKKEDVKAEEPKKEEPKKEEPKKEETKPVASGDTITIVVEKGNGSDAVARKLAQAGLVPDAVAYDVWLCQNGYDRKISAGTHVIPKGASNEQIAQIISGR